jgi:hypothetical protein
VWGAIIYKYFCAPPLVNGLSHVYSDSFSVQNIFNGLFLNVKNNIRLIIGYTSYYPMGILSLITLLFLFIVVSVKQIENYKINIKGIGLSFLILFTSFVFFVFYTYQLFFVEKQLAFCLFLLFYMLVKMNFSRKTIWVLIVMLLFPFTIGRTMETIKDRRNAYEKQTLDRIKLQGYFNCLEKVKGNNKINLIGIDPSGFGVERNTILGNLKFSSSSTKIVYANPMIFSVSKNNYNDFIDKIDYYLSYGIYKSDRLKLLYSSDGYFLYKKI